MGVRTQRSHNHSNNISNNDIPRLPHTVLYFSEVFHRHASQRLAPCTGRDQIQGMKTQRADAMFVSSTLRFLNLRVYIFTASGMRIQL